MLFRSIERKLYPNVDFYSGIIYKALGIPVDMFTVFFAIGRMPGWISQWLEYQADPEAKITRPRQIYMGDAAHLHEGRGALAGYGATRTVAPAGTSVVPL